MENFIFLCIGNIPNFQKIENIPTEKHDNHSQMKTDLK